MSKGDKRRKLQVSYEQWAKNYEAIFGEKKPKRKPVKRKAAKKAVRKTRKKKG
tara:strand:+ start:604 stop:762 length:159 start_codon:yes stop_codon:yes gene_type:complete